MRTTDLYFEAHVTIDPVEELMAWTKLTSAAKMYDFRVAEFLYKKTRKVARPDDFLTTRSNDYDDILARTQGIVVLLQVLGYRVRRYKIEDTLLDVRLLD